MHCSEQWRSMHRQHRHHGAAYCRSLGLGLHCSATIRQAWAEWGEHQQQGHHLRWVVLKIVCWEVVWTIIMLCAGGYDGNFLDSILQFDGETQQWKEIGQLRRKRDFHAASVVNINKIAAYLNCGWIFLCTALTVSFVCVFIIIIWIFKG